MNPSETQFRYLMNPIYTLRRFLRHREPLVQLSKREIARERKGNILGDLWLIVTPLIMMALYSFVFGVLLGARYTQSSASSGYEFAMGIFLGLIIFNVLSEAFSKGPNLITSAPNFVKKVVFPLEIIPAANLVSSAYKFLISVAILIVAKIAFGVEFSWYNLLLPVVLIPIFLASLGLYALLSSLGVFVRDIRQMTSPISIALLYGSAIFYPPELIAEKAPSLWILLEWNPVMQSIDMARKLFLWNQPVDLAHLALIYMVAIFLFSFGFAVFHKTRPSFSDLL